MLSNILSKETCKECKYCCYLSYDEYDDLVAFSDKEVSNIKEFDNKRFLSIPFVKKNDFNYIDIRNLKTKVNANNYYECPFHSDDIGCLISDNKPICCKLWPYAVMKKDGEIGVYVSKECPSFNKKNLDEIRKFFDTELYEKIIALYKLNECHTTEYNDDYVFLRELAINYIIIHKC